jgi:hypothetical protein
VNLNLLLALVTGSCFAFWPLAMNQSNVRGIPFAFLYSLMTAFCALPFAIRDGVGSAVRWGYVLAAVALIVISTFTFNIMMSRTTKLEASTYFLVVIVTQTVLVSLAAVAANNWTVGWSKVVGLIFALGAVYLLMK